MLGVKEKRMHLSLPNPTNHPILYSIEEASDDKVLEVIHPNHMSGMIQPKRIKELRFPSGTGKLYILIQFLPNEEICGSSNTQKQSHLSLHYWKVVVQLKDGSILKERWKRFPLTSSHQKYFSSPHLISQLNYPNSNCNNASNLLASQSNKENTALGNELKKDSLKELGGRRDVKLNISTKSTTHPSVNCQNFSQPCKKTLNASTCTFLKSNTISLNPESDHAKAVSGLDTSAEIVQTKSNSSQTIESTEPTEPTESNERVCGTNCTLENHSADTSPVQMNELDCSKRNTPTSCPPTFSPVSILKKNQVIGNIHGSPTRRVTFDLSMSHTSEITESSTRRKLDVITKGGDEVLIENRLIWRVYATWGPRLLFLCICSLVLIYLVYYVI